MTWFKVDDSFHSHPKVLAAQPAALGLWVIAGAWCSANLTDGFVPDYVLPRLLPASTQLAEALATCGLWKRAKGGYRFHDWSVYQPTKEEATAAMEKKSSGGSLGNHRRWHTGTGKQNPHCPFCQGKQPSDIRSLTDRVSDGVSESHPNPPTRPDPKGRVVQVVKEGDSSVTRANAEPPKTCPEHLNDPNPPACGRCKEARQTAEQWHADKRARLAVAPGCRVDPSHRGQPADNCANCRSDQLALTGRTGAFQIVTRSAS